jgi:hypothetical protein
MATPLSIKELTLVRGSSRYSPTGDTYKRIFRIVLTDRLAAPDDLDTIKALPGIPTEGSRLKSSDPRVVDDIDVTALDETGSEFLVTVNYKVPTFDSALEPDPLSRLDEIDGFDSTEESIPIYQDYSDPPKDCVNTAGMPLGSDVTSLTGGFDLVITGNRASIDAVAYASYQRPKAINDAHFQVRSLGIGPGQALLRKISIKPTVEGRHRFLRITWYLSLAPSWDVELYSRGLVDKDGKRKQIQVGSAPPEFVSQPWPLDSNGDFAATATTTPAIVTFKPQPRMDFSYFGWTP